MTAGEMDRPTTSPTCNRFPLAGLPLEIRDKIWEECIIQETSTPEHTTASRLHRGWSRDFGEPDDRGISLAVGHYGRFYTSQLPAVAFACRESYDAARRVLTRAGPKPLPCEYRIPVIQSLRPARTDPLVPLLALDPETLGGAIIIVLGADLDASTADPVHANRLLDMLLAAGDDQVKLLLPELEVFVLPDDGGDGALTAGWKPASDYTNRIVSVHDVAAWKELKGIAKHYGYPWPFVESLLGSGGNEREKLVEKAIAPLREMWERENDRRRSAGEELLAALPRLDGCVRVDIQVGGPMSMVGFKGVPDKRTLDELLRWGVLDH